MRAGLVVVSCLLFLGTAAHAQKPTAEILKTYFEDGDGGWTVLGGDGKVSVTGQSQHVKEGMAALRYDYPVAKGKLSFLMHGVPEGGLAGMRSLRFWIKADFATPVIVSIQEKEGGRWNAAFSAPANSWQRVELIPSDFEPSDGPQDPKDPNDKLDLDKVEGIGLVDVGQIFVQLEMGEFFQKVLGVKPGDRTMYIDEFLISEEPLPGVAAETAAVGFLDTFSRPQSAWMGLFGAKVSSGEVKPLSGKGMQVSYRQAPDTYPGVLRTLKRGSLAGATRLTFDAASTRPAELTVQLEEVGGGKYNAQLSMEGGSNSRALSISLADMKPSDDSRDSNSKLDLDQVKQILILDVAGALNQVDQENTLWIGNLKAVK